MLLPSFIIAGDFLLGQCRHEFIREDNMPVFGLKNGQFQQVEGAAAVACAQAIERIRFRQFDLDAVFPLDHIGSLLHQLRQLRRR